MDETIAVEVGEDHLAAFRRSPGVAIAELIWNGPDADAKEVVVEYELNALDGVEAVTVRDNGLGKAQRELMRDGIWQELTTRFAPYLEQYPGTRIIYRGNSLNPDGMRERTDISMISLEADDIEATLTI